MRIVLLLRNVLWCKKKAGRAVKHNLGPNIYTTSMEKVRAKAFHLEVKEILHVHSTLTEEVLYNDFLTITCQCK